MYYGLYRKVFTMKNILLLSLILSVSMPFLAEDPSTDSAKPAAAVTLAGGVLKNKSSDAETKKYPRKDCPVCEGKGWYMSGDGIKKIECQYCEPSKEAPSSEDQQANETETTEKDPPALVPVEPEETKPQQESQRRRILIHRR